MPTINEPLLRHVVRLIRDNPTRWNQRKYVDESDCGTTYCLAGWVYRVTVGEPPMDDGAAIHITAARALGLDLGDAGRLFNFTDVGEVTLNETGGIARVYYRHPTFEEYVHQILKVTGVNLDDLLIEGIAMDLPGEIEAILTEGTRQPELVG